MGCNVLGWSVMYWVGLWSVMLWVGLWSVMPWVGLKSEIVICVCDALGWSVVCDCSL